MDRQERMLKILQGVFTCVVWAEQTGGKRTFGLKESCVNAAGYPKSIRAREQGQEFNVKHLPCNKNEELVVTENNNEISKKTM